MKNFKRMLSLLLAVVMVIGISAFTFADDATTYSITVDDSTKGLTYEAYQIFKGTVNGTNLIVSDWGSGIDNSSALVLNDYVKRAEEATANTDLANDFARELLPLLGTATKTTTGDSYVISGLEPGYYLVKASDGTATLALLQLVNSNTTVTPKKDAPEFEKKVWDVNDSDATVNAEDTTKGWQDSADYDIGDDVPFRLTAKLGSDVENYNAYPIEFEDTLSEGLTYNYGIKVMLGDEDVTKWFTVKLDDTAKDIKIFTKDAKAFGATNNSTIVVTYYARLNAFAEIGSTGNPNKAQLVYANNPNVKYPEYSDNTKENIKNSDKTSDDYTDENPSGGGDGTDINDQKAPDEYTSDDATENGGTPTTGTSNPDKVIVFTYQVVINKVDEDNKPLNGATFELYKKLSAGSTEKIDAETSEDGTVFTFKGLDDGTYVIKETNPPTNYNAISDIEFTISAEHDTTSEDPTLISLNGVTITDTNNGEITLSGDQKATVGITDSNGTKSLDGTITTTIKNFKGSTLPETGGMGTKLFYVFGGLLVLGASVLLITKKRMNNI